MKITGAWEVPSRSRPGFMHRVTRYEVPHEHGAVTKSHAVWCCTCEDAYFKHKCHHIEGVQANLNNKGILP